MLYLDFAKNKEDFILENEEKFPYLIKNFLYLFRKFSGQVIRYSFDGKNVVLISRINKRVLRKIDKILKIDVTKNICVCDYLMEKSEIIDFLLERNLNIMNGKWLFKYLICDISEFICNQLDLTPESQEISLLVNEPNIIVFDVIKKLSNKFKNINIITTKIKKFQKIEKEVYDENGLILNVTNNFKNACEKSKIVFNFDFDEKMFNRVRFLASSIIINVERHIDIKQSNFVGKNIDFYNINLPKKYKKIYDRLNNFNSSILYESLIYKRTSNKNIFNEIKEDNIEITVLESQGKAIKFYQPLTSTLTSNL